MTENKKFASNFNAVMLILLLFVIGANVWLVIKDIYTGVIYLSLFSGGVIAVMVYNFFAKGEQQLSLVKQILKSPFEKSIYLGSFLLLAGMASRLILQLVLSIIGKSFNSFSIPLFSSKLLQGVSQSFSVAEIERSNSWKIFNIVVNAGISEEFIFAFIIPLLFVAVLTLVVYGLYKGNTQRTSQFLKRYFIVIISCAILVSVLIFTGLHSLNQTYDSAGAYLKAGIFRGLSMITIYFSGLFFSFWAGFHMTHNAIWLISDPTYGIGLIPFFQGLINGVGLFVTGVIMFSTGIVVFGWNKVKADLRELKFFGK